MAGILAFFVSAIVVSFLCSMWEAVLLSVTPMYLNRQLQAGTPYGKQLAAFKKDIDRPLSAILTLNTIAHTVGAIGVGVQAEKVLDARKLDLWLISVSCESLVAAGMTLAGLPGAPAGGISPPFVVASHEVAVRAALVLEDDAQAVEPRQLG